MMFLAMRILWTSSGPSARRRILAVRYMPASGRSLLTPAPPQTWMARSTTRWKAAGTKTLMAEIAVRASGSPLATFSAALMVMSRADWTSM